MKILTIIVMSILIFGCKEDLNYITNKNITNNVSSDTFNKNVFIYKGKILDIKIVKNNRTSKKYHISFYDYQKFYDIYNDSGLISSGTYKSDTYNDVTYIIIIDSSSGQGLITLNNKTKKYRISSDYLYFVDDNLSDIGIYHVDSQEGKNEKIETN